MVNGLLVKSLPRHPQRRLHRADGGASSTRSRRAQRRLGAAAAPASTTPFKRRPGEGQESRCATSSARRCPPSHVCEKCGKPMVIKWGRNGHVPGLPGLPRVPQHQGISRAAPTARSRSCPSTAHRRGVPDLRLADGHQARPLRRVPGLLALPRLQDHEAHLAGRRLPEAGLRRLPDREALASAARCSSAARTTPRPSATSCTWDRPIPEACPQCQAPFMVKRENRSGITVRCLSSPTTSAARARRARARPPGSWLAPGARLAP